MKTLALDFDGVLHRDKYGFSHGVICDEPMEGALEAVRELSTEYILVVCTARKDLKPVRVWLKKWGFPKMKVTNTKPRAKAYIDDRAVRFISWKDALNYFV